MTDLPPGWEWASLEDVADIRGGIQKQAKRRPVKNKYPFLRVANVLRGKLDLSDVHEVELFDGELDRYRLRRGDLLVVEGNGSPDQIGRGAVWDGSIEDCVHQNHLIRVRPTQAILPEYLQYAWNAPATSDHLRRVAGSTSGLYTLSTAKLKTVTLPLPPIAEQHRIVATIENYLSRIDAAVALLSGHASGIHTVGGAIGRSSALRRSLLAQAFAGRLVEQDPGDEPASELLARIRAERASASTQKRTRTPRTPEQAPAHSPGVTDGTYQQEELSL